METLSIRFKSPLLAGTVAVPGSKSLGNRLLVLAYLGGRLHDYYPDNMATADDTVRMRRLLDEVAAQRVVRAPRAPHTRPRQFGCAHPRPRPGG
ncbi:MAG: hypothetical protein K2F84_06970, partial [Bacteroidales bacterium]|nr:hypothetical protein [Bacteroidales bacterium]